VPVLDDTVAWVAGPVLELIPGGDHVIAITAAERFEAPGGDPLLFHAGEYR
jgi:flavin reductase (DIM6/NTAB) family NADH-FMN oxidoreductase RutF